MKRLLTALILLLALFSNTLQAQTEVMAWGNITGIRVEGHLMAFESYLTVAGNDLEKPVFTGKERQRRPQYQRDGVTQQVTTDFQGVRFEQTVTDTDRATAKVTVRAFLDTTETDRNAFFTLLLNNSTLRKTGKTIILENNNVKLTLTFSRKIQVREKDGICYIPLFSSLKKGTDATINFTIRAEGPIDRKPAIIQTDFSRPGRRFDGFGGNFRLQNPQMDPKVIDYCLDNMRVAWGRVEMPWANWQPFEDQPPASDQRVEDAMKMTRRLAARGIPVIVSVWFPPAWAVEGDIRDYWRRGGGVRAYRLNPEKKEAIYQSLADYLVYLKKHYGVEAYAFSFNESDLGIDVLHTPWEHAEFIKEMGAVLAERNLATKILLGDNSDATTYDFIVPAMEDPSTHKYIAAVSFHSWRGCDDATLEKWAGAARKLNIPLIVGEGSTDAAAHRYPQIFAESAFAFYEINLYIRICALCEPLSILQWQLTSDYSILWGDGIYGSEGILHPTQRFWNLKQLASTPEGVFSIPVSCDTDLMNCAAFGNPSNGSFALHIVNNGASRDVTFKGMPSGEIVLYATNVQDGMKEIGRARAQEGNLKCTLPATSFISLICSSGNGP
jgi:hypothetical protein